jgi:hypothetical protein
MKGKLSAFAGRPELTCVTLAAAEVCWVAPVFLVLERITGRHPPLLLWLAMLTLLLGFFYVYRALARADLPPWFQQSLWVAALLLSIGFVLRTHVYAGAGLQGADWLLQPFRSFADLSTLVPAELVAILVLIYLWARGAHLARRSLSAAAVGFSFRAGVVILIWLVLVIELATEQDVSGFVVSYFFFALIAVALSRIEEVSRTPGSPRAPFTGFWVGSAVTAVALVVLLGSLVAVFFSGGGFRQLLQWLSPVWYAVGFVIFGIVVLLLMLVEFVIRLIPVDWVGLRDQLAEIMKALSDLWQEQPSIEEPTTILPPPETLKVGGTVSVVVGLIVLVVFLTWWRVRRARREAVDESRESLLSARTLARHLQDMLQSGRDRLGELAGLVDRFGLGSRFLSAITIRRIYANLVRLATQTGHPRTQAQTPLEYLETLYEAFTGSEVEVRVITEAYINAHYGQVPDSQEELRRIRDCWERVRARQISHT